MATTVEPVDLPALTERMERTWTTPKTLYGALSTVDHKTVGKRYLATAFVFLLLGGLEASLMRTQLARPENALLSPEQYDQLFSMHGTTMIFWYAAPILSGFSNYLIPLMIGARDTAYPRLNAFSYWAFLLSGIFIYTSFLGGVAPHGGWFAYPPYTGPQYSPGLHMDFYALALLFLTISTTAGAINLIVTIFKLRCPGMSISRMPLFCWSTLTNSVSIVFALPALSAALIFLEFDRRFGTHFYDPIRGGHPLLWQHLFWVFGHPWVYIIILPATGMASMIIPTFCRRPIVGHVYVALATVSTGIFGFGVWAHHMFATGMPELSTTFFSAASMSVSIPSGIQIFAWLATIWAARRHVFATPFLFILGFLCLFVIGGISGVMVASVPFDLQATDTYFVVAHLHYVLVGINLFPVLAGFYYWLPKMTGRMLDERLGRWNFWVLFAGVNLTFFPMHVVGLRGMARRLYTYPSGLGWDALNLAETVGAFVTAVGVLLFVVNVLYSRKRGRVAEANPWGAGSLEWSTSSPPREYNFAIIPRVAGREPLWEADNAIATGNEATLPSWQVLDDGKETLGTTILEGDPQRALRMPEDSVAPLTLALALAALSYALLFRQPVAVAISLLAVAATITWWLWPEARRDAPVPFTEAQVGSRSTVWWGMLWFCATEAMLFACFIASYFFLRGNVRAFGAEGGRYVPLTRPIIMTVLLVASSVAAWWGERGIRQGDARRLRMGVAVAMLLGVTFVGMQIWEYVERDIVWTASGYHSLFMTITGFHGAHVVVGLLMLLFIAVRAWRGHFDAARHEAASNAILYWHFVDGVWLVVFSSLYLSPRLF